MSQTRGAGFENVSIERVRDYWDARPCNVRHSRAVPGSRQYFEEVEARKYRVEPHIPGFADFERWRGCQVLEIGCGLGTDTINFARCGALVTAVDLSEKSLELARQRAEVFQLLDRIRFLRADTERLGDQLPTGNYDLVYSFGVIHHTPHPERALDEMRKFSKPGGTLKLMVYHKWSWKVFWILLVYGHARFWRLSRLIAEYSEAQTGCPVTYAYSRRQARRLVEEHGFEVTDVRVEHIFPYKIEDYVEHRYREVWYFRWLPRTAFRWLERRLGWHLCVTATAR
jgi:SAM-dependent methyltransferase